jgi:hypothetical protein
MKFIFGVVGWCLLLAICWPLALLALIALPAIWLLSLPFRLVFHVIAGILAFLRTLFLLPARIPGYGKTSKTA